ncbi:MAG: DsrE family protein [gamma proteobacterium endosymbiont of Lamellibrachia anaximandri]|nr:DsrE family protein [gamma proteobacterium endosymbiont of Lamellibrachia anaximandri]MBL3618381.1 DsrE family protein [gamma proteobacterium endosymbiont of Lamellibrachia anaximandri]
MNTLIILNDPPYGTERSYNGLRLAMALSKTDKAELSSSSAQTKLMPLRYKAELSSLSAQTKLIPGGCTKVTVFLMADAVVCAKRGQKTPQGFYNIELMLNSVLRKGEVLLCGACMDARGFADDEIVQDARRSTMKELAERTLAADKVLVF